MAAEDGEGEPPPGSSSPEAVAAAGLRAGKSLREIAIDLYGVEEVAAGWHRDGWMRAMVRRLVGRARAGSGGGPGVAGAGTK